MKRSNVFCPGRSLLRYVLILALLPFRAKESNPHVHRTCELSRDLSRDEEACAERPKVVGDSTTKRIQLKTRASAAFSP